MNDISTRTFEQNGLTFTVRWVYNENPDLSLLGEWQSTITDYCVDRQQGVLLGEEIEGPEEPRDEDFAEGPEGELAYDHAYNNYYAKCDVWNSWHCREVLATSLSSGKRDKYDFGGFQHLPHNPKNWEHVTPEQLATAMDANKAKLAQYEVAEGDDTWRLDVLYSVLAYERAVAYSNGDWHMMGCVVEITAGGYQVGYDGLWGIESDCGEYREQIEKDCIAQAIATIDQAAVNLAAAVVAVEKFREGVV